MSSSREPPSTKKRKRSIATQEGISVRDAAKKYIIEINKRLRVPITPEQIDAWPFGSTRKYPVEQRKEYQKVTSALIFLGASEEEKEENRKKYRDKYAGLDETQKAEKTQRSTRAFNKYKKTNRGRFVLFVNRHREVCPDVHGNQVKLKNLTKKEYDEKIDQMDTTESVKTWEDEESLLHALHNCDDEECQARIDLCETDIPDAAECAFCCDHTDALSRIRKDDDTTADNIQLVCTTCKILKRGDDEEEFEAWVRKVVTHHDAGHPSSVTEELDDDIIAEKLRVYEVRRKHTKRYNKDGRRDYDSTGEGVTYRTDDGESLLLTADDLRELFYGSCYWCGKPSTNDSVNGVDRLDNLQPYTKKNSVSCCQTCNFKKSIPPQLGGHDLDETQIIEHLRKIVEKREL